MSLVDSHDIQHRHRHDFPHLNWIEYDWKIGNSWQCLISLHFKSFRLRNSNARLLAMFCISSREMFLLRRISLSIFFHEECQQSLCWRQFRCVLCEAGEPSIPQVTKSLTCGIDSSLPHRLGYQEEVVPFRQSDVRVNHSTTRGIGSVPIYREPSGELQETLYYL